MPRFLLGLLCFVFIVLMTSACAGVFNSSNKSEDNKNSNVSSVSYAEEPEGYRLTDYKSDVPRTLNGGNVVSIEEAKQLFDNGEALFVDVLYYNYKPDSLPEGTVWIPKARKNIPGSIWLANVGMGEVSTEQESYFKQNLMKYTEGNFDRKIVFYCQPKCWLSWNAAKRAISYSYKNVFWFPGGVAEWEAKGYPLQDALPIPFSN